MLLPGPPTQPTPSSRLQLRRPLCRELQGLPPHAPRLDCGPVVPLFGDAIHDRLHPVGRVPGAPEGGGGQGLQGGTCVRRGGAAAIHGLPLFYHAFAIACTFWAAIRVPHEGGSTAPLPPASRPISPARRAAAGCCARVAPLLPLIASLPRAVPAASARCQGTCNQHQHGVWHLLRHDLLGW